ncbi:MAG TPA: hypothetical protein VG269_05065 [Tepidisphaeraceae bacterium]|jgi:hypothetical protein|nr:hypothetical protein [Tepidisphaeraceae bacterium]
MNATRLSLALIFATILAATSAVRAEDRNNDFKSGPIDCDVLKNHPNARIERLVKDLIDDKPKPIDHIDELRKRFWEMYAFDHTSEDCDKARDEFAQALFMKDLYYLQLNVVARTWAPNPNRLTGEQEDLPNKLIDLMGAGEDGGIPRSALPTFIAWVNATRDAMGFGKGFDAQAKVMWKVNVGILSADYRKAMNFGGKEYQEYVMERDWAEFAAINRVPAGYDHKETYGVFLYYRPGNNSFHDANLMYAGMEKALGKEAAQAAAESVRVAPKTKAGDLVQRDLGEPVKLGPGGGKVPDYDAPLPQGVIGVYKDPCLAMEILATRDDDRRYLMYLLKHQYWKNASSIKQATDEWTFAAALYKQLTLAFGEQDVLASARLVRTATKRWISGNVMDQKAIGATRNNPLEAFEDILSRKNPKGYVRATLAFDQNLQKPEEVDAAYQKLVASSSETAILETAKKVVAEKPLFGYRLELQEFVKAMNAPPPAPAQPAGPLYDFPEYVAWKGFAPGAKASYVSRTWEQNPPGGDRLAPTRTTERHTFTLQNTTPERELFWLTEIAYDPTGAAHPPSDSEFTYPAKIAMRMQRTQGPAAKGRPARGMATEGPAPTTATRRPGPPTQTAPEVTTVGPAPTPPATTADAAVSSRRLNRFTVPPTAPMETGEEVIEIKGKKIATRWQSQTFTFAPKSPYPDSTLIVKVWTSDAVPSGLVRKTEDRITPTTRTHRGERIVQETYLESFEGTKEGIKPPDPSAKAVAAYVPPPVALGLAAPLAPAPTSPPGAGPAAPASPPAPTAPAATQPAVQRPAPPPRARRPAPVLTPQQEFTQRYTAVTTRLIQARAALARTQRTRGAQDDNLPAEVRDARDRAIAKRKAAEAALSENNLAEAEKELKAMDEAVTVLEDYVKK